MAKIRAIFKEPAFKKRARSWERAYIAGVLDAKASLAINTHRIKKRKRAKLDAAASLQGHDIKQLRMIQERYGGIIKFVDLTKEKGITMYRLEIARNDDILSLLKDVSGYLIAKSKQAHLLWKYCQSRREALERAENSFQAPITEEERAIAEELRRVNKLFLHPEQSP